MTQRENEIKSVILSLERELTDPLVRADAKRVSEILAKDFVEFGRSGGVYSYKLGDTFVDTDGRKYLGVEDINIKMLSENVVLATYTGSMSLDGLIRYTNRSSIWKLVNSRWRLVFHQGTPNDTELDLKII